MHPERKINQNNMELLLDKQKRIVWYRAFRIWQHRPHMVAPLSETNHICASCGTSFQGNYCPRCGQVANVGRFSFKKAFLNFIDVWGMGNRGMFRSIRDLILRPGYMIRDYLSGMQSAYFPPFKMFFLFAALSLVVDQGFSLNLEEETKYVEVNKTEQMADQGTSGLRVNGVATDAPIVMSGFKLIKMMDVLRTKNPAIFSLLTLALFSLPLYIFFRNSPNIPDLKYPEFLVALVYTSNTYSIYSIVGRVLNSDLIKLLAVIMIFVALKQISGFSKHRVLGYIVLAFIIALAIFIALAAVAVGIYYCFQ